MPLTSSGFEAMLDRHVGLEEAFLSHQRALVVGDFEAAARLLKRFQASLLDHLVAETSFLPAADASGEEVSRQPEETSLLEVDSVLRQLTDECVADVDLLAQIPDDISDRIVHLLEKERTIKLLLQSHDRREQALFARHDTPITLEETEPGHADPVAATGAPVRPHASTWHVGVKDYVAMVNWKRRLEREGPFFNQQFREHGVHKILDAACGPGYHAAFFAQSGYETRGVDLSADMVAHAINLGSDAQFALRDMRELHSLEGHPYDAVVCVGNALASLLTEDDLHAFLCGVRTCLRPGGILILQVLNFARMIAHGERLQPVRTSPDGEHIYLKIFDLAHGVGAINLIVLQRDGAGWESHMETSPLRMWQAGRLREALAETGYKVGEWLGGYDGTPFDEEQSADLICVAVRGKTGPCPACD